MSNLLKLKRSNVPGRLPQLGDLVLGELAVNTYDGRLFIKTNVNGSESIVTISNNYYDLTHRPPEYDFKIAGDDSVQRTISAGETVKFLGSGGLSVTTDAEGNVNIDLSESVLSPLVFSSSGNYKTLTGYTESSVTYNIRTTSFYNNLLRLELATFTPLLSATTLPGVSLNWDQPVTSFTAVVDNPSDFTTQYIDGAVSVTAQTGTISALNTFTASSKSLVPGGGVDWTQTFTVFAGVSYIRPSSTSGITGGSNTFLINFSYFNGTTSVNYTSSSASLTINWATPTISININDLSGNTFLQSYSSTTYTVSHTGLSNNANVSHLVTPTGGTVTNSSGSGTFNFTNAIHKNNTGTSRSLALTSTFTRPSTVTGSSYTAQLNTSDPSITASFTYPSFWIFTLSVSSPPTRADIINGTGFESTVTVLGNQTITFNQIVNVTGSVPKVFWFSVRNAITQPSNFKTGPSQSLLVDVEYTMTTVSLEPDSPPSGYISESYKLYGIILQPGNTYVSIS